MNKSPIFVVLFLALFMVFSLGGICSAGAVIIKTQPDLGGIIVNTPTITTTVKAPSGLTASSPEVGVVMLHWNDNSSNETGFAIERRFPDDDEYFQVATESTNATSYEESELSTWPVHAGEKYYYRVRAFKGDTYSSCSNEVYVEIKGLEPNPSGPAALRAKGLMSDGQLVVRLFWGDTSDNEDKFVVQRKKANGGYTAIGELPANSVKFEDASELERNVTYTYRVIAYNSGGAGVSNEAQVLLPVSAPGYPAMNLPQTKGSTAILLTWTDNANNEDGFILTRYGDKPANPFTGTTDPDKEYVLDPNTTSLLVDGLTPLKKYGFELVAYNALGKSIPTICNAYTGSYPPNSLTASALSPNQVKLTWAQSYHVEGFAVERKKAGENYTQVTTLPGTPNGGTATYTDPLLQLGTQYFYRVRSWFNVYGDATWYYSDYSNEIGITTPGQSTSNIVGGSTGKPVLPGVLAGRKVIALTLGQKEYRVDGEVQQMDAAPISHEGRTLMPIRYLTEPLGATLDWDGTAQKVTISLDGRTIELFIGQNKARVNGQEVMIDPSNPAVVPITVPPGRTMLPVRFISENLGCQVEWDPTTNTASLSYGG